MGCCIPHAFASPATGGCVRANSTNRIRNASASRFTGDCVRVSTSPEDTAAQVGVCAIVAKPANFNHQTVTLQGTATALKETTSHRGNDYTTFKLQDPSGCGAVNIFTWGHPALIERRSSPRGRCIRDRTS